ncbi:MAG: hypothetical protein GWM92_20185, partial [Gemmatimonadetes bacterium]|nr:hypothetical protein [Gemmatimonadota bacterium]NIT89972.1 hypothetical protein [Gemmatimonadota bacterium]NIU33785.1 hypothetical protein [Gemmatimonadota bacterium]NIU52924.1 hypothetical protein [Gemmatimonadota bacterium]NIV64111.1 hypothetical protein [Gemmatimonadota bacterium]
MDTRRHDRSRRPAPDIRGDDRAGFALEATMMIMILLGGLILVLVQTATTAFRTGFLDYTNSRAFYAAEAGAEAAMGQVAIRMEDGVLDDQDISEIVPPDLEGFSFDSFAVQKIGAVDVETITDGPFSGLYSLTQYVEVYSEAREPAGSSNAVLVSAKAQAIPIFQFGVFFEKDLEATNGPPMEFAGWVHSNGNIYLSSDNAWYRDQITTPNKLFWDRKDNHSVKDGVYVNDAM